jgi:hypothetical protein
MNKFTKHQLHRASRGFTLAEAAVCTVIVAMMLVAAMRAAAVSGVYQYKMAERATARFLADGLMADIHQLSYQDPGAAPQFGPEAPELASSKANYNDVDDFNGWSESPPQDRDGNVLPGLTGWQRSVAVQWVKASDISQTSATESGAKRITVTVSHNNVVVLTRVALRTSAP